MRFGFGFNCRNDSGGYLSYRPQLRQQPRLGQPVRIPHLAGLIRADFLLRLGHSAQPDLKPQDLKIVTKKKQ